MKPYQCRDWSSFMKHLFAYGCLIAGLSSQALAAGSSSDAAKQDHEILRKAATDFLTQLSATQPGDAHITVGQIDNRLNLAACDAPTPFLPPGGKTSGKISVGVRCSIPVNWVVYIQASVQVNGEYYVAARPLSQGQIIGTADLNKIKGEISNLPPGIIHNPDQAIGKALQLSIAAGTPIRLDSLKSPAVIQQGQSVRIISNGPGFQVATDAQSLSNAAEGQIARAKTSSGQTVSGIAKAGGVIEINY